MALVHQGGVPGQVADQGETVRVPLRSVRESFVWAQRPSVAVCTQFVLPSGNTALTGRIVGLRMEFFVLDIVFVLGVIAVFALIGVVSWGVAKL